MRPAAPAALLWLALSTLSPALASTAWVTEPGSAIRFTAFQQGAPIEGRFERFSAEITFDPDDLAASRIVVDIDATSVTTGHGDRDQMLHSPALFDVETWPTARFESQSVTGTGEAGYVAQGTLTIRDVTEDVSLPFTLTIDDHPDDAARRRAHAMGELTIDRLDYGVGQGDFASTATVGNEVVIAIEILAGAPR